jgi:hypothetical protein
MLYGYFSLFLYIIEDLKKYIIEDIKKYIIEDLKNYIYIIYAIISTSIHSDTIYKISPSIHLDTIYKTEGSSSNNEDKNEESNVNEQPDDEAGIEEESFEIEEELAHIKKVLKMAENARVLHDKLPDSQKNKNSHLHDLKKESHVREFFDDKPFNIDDVVELEEAL